MVEEGKATYAAELYDNIASSPLSLEEDIKTTQKQELTQNNKALRKLKQ